MNTDEHRFGLRVLDYASSLALLTRADRIKAAEDWRSPSRMRVYPSVDHRGKAVAE